MNKPSSIITTFIVMLALLLSCYGYPGRLVCYSKTKLQSLQIYSLFKQYQPGFYIDVYPEHPLLDSNTLYLSTQNWKGINIISTKQSHTRFQQTRQRDLNILLQNKANPPKLPLSSLCQISYPQRPGLLSSSLLHLSYIMDTNNWQKQLCKPEVIIIRKQADDKIDGQYVDRLKGYGYEQPQYFQDIVVFVDGSRQVGKGVFVRDDDGVEKEIGYGDLVSFSSILRNIVSKLLDRVLNITQITNLTISHNLQILLPTHPQPILIPNIIHKYPNTQYFLILQYNPEYNKLILPQASYTITHMKIEQKQQYYVIKYRNTLMGQDRQYGFYVFDHGGYEKGRGKGKGDKDGGVGSIVGVGDVERMVVENLGLGFSVGQFRGSEIEKYDITDIKQFQEQSNKQNNTLSPQNSTQSLKLTISTLQTQLSQTQQSLQHSQKQYNNQHSLSNSQKKTIQKQQQHLQQLQQQLLQQQTQQQQQQKQISIIQYKYKQQLQQYVIIFGICFVFCVAVTVFCTLCAVKRVQQWGIDRDGTRLQNNSQVEFQGSGGKKQGGNQGQVVEMEEH